MEYVNNIYDHIHISLTLKDFEFVLGSWWKATMLYIIKLMRNSKLVNMLLDFRLLDINIAVISFAL